MKLIENWRDGYKFAVQWVQTFGATAMLVWLGLTEEQRQSILALFGFTPDRMVALTALTIFGAGIVARMVKQPAIEK